VAIVKNKQLNRDLNAFPSSNTPFTEWHSHGVFDQPNPVSDLQQTGFRFGEKVYSIYKSETGCGFGEICPMTSLLFVYHGLRCFVELMHCCSLLP